MTTTIHPPETGRLVAELAGHEGFKLELSAMDLFTIVAQLQLALRHPENTGEGREMIESFINAVIHTGFEHCSEVQNALLMGLDARFDMETSTFADQFTL